MAISADQGHAGQGEALFRADDVHDAVARIVYFIQFDPELRAVAAQSVDLKLRVFRDILVAIGCDIMVDYRKRQFRPPDFTARQLQPFERLRTGHLMDDVPVDIEQAGAVLLLVDQMRFPNLVEECAGLRHVPSLSNCQTKCSIGRPGGQSSLAGASGAGTVCAAPVIGTSTSRRVAFSAIRALLPRRPRR